MNVNDPQLTTREQIMELLRSLQKDKSTLHSVLAEKLSRAAMQQLRRLVQLQ